MRRHWLIFGILVLSSYTSLAQQEYKHRNFESLPDIPALRHYEEMYKLKFNNIAACFNIISFNLMDSFECTLIYTRLKDIAVAFAKEGIPLILMDQAADSDEKATILNKEGNSTGATYLSLGNTLLILPTHNEAIRAFNAATQQWLENHGNSKSGK